MPPIMTKEVNVEYRRMYGTVVCGPENQATFKLDEMVDLNQYVGTRVRVELGLKEFKKPTRPLSEQVRDLEVALEKARRDAYL